MVENTDTVEDTQRVIRKNLHDPSFNLQQAAKLLLRSSRSLQRELQAEGSLGFRNELWQARMRQAQSLLLAGLSPRLVADKVGYKRTEHFSKAFARWSGQTPTRWLADAAKARQAPHQKAERHALVSRGKHGQSVSHRRYDYTE